MGETSYGQGKQISGDDLEQALSRGEFDRPTAALTGMFKASKETHHISFTPSGCDSWIDIPTSLISTAERIGHQSCRDHSHPIFALTLIEPTDPQAKVLTAILKSMRTNRTNSYPDRETGDGSGPTVGFPGVTARTAGGGFSNGAGPITKCGGCVPVCVRKEWRLHTDGKSFWMQEDCVNYEQWCWDCASRFA
jgi:hypothetical protein